MIGKINVGGSGGGLEINGIIESYVASAGGSITAGDFVTFVNDFGTGAQTRISGVSVYGLSAATLSSDKVFVLYRNTSNQLAAVVCTISGTTITAGSSVQLDISQVNMVAAAALSSDKVCAVYGHYDGSFYNMYGLVCTISGTTITAGPRNNLSWSQTLNRLIVTTLSSNKVFVLRSWPNSYELNGLVCTISGTTITAGSSNNLTNYLISPTVTALSSDKVFITSEDGDYKRYGLVCTISGTTITAGSSVQLVNNAYNSSAAAVALSSDKVLVVYTIWDGSNNYLAGLVCLIGGTTIAAGPSMQLASISIAGGCAAATLSSDKVFVLFQQGTSSAIWHGLVCAISGTTITAGSSVQLVNNSRADVSVVALNSGKVFVLEGSTYDLRCRVVHLLIKTVTNGSDAILGVAKTSAAAWANVDVYIPNV